VELLCGPLRLVDSTIETGLRGSPTGRFDHRDWSAGQSHWLRGQSHWSADHPDYSRGQRQRPVTLRHCGGNSSPGSGRRLRRHADRREAAAPSPEAAAVTSSSSSPASLSAVRCRSPTSTRASKQGHLPREPRRGRKRGSRMPLVHLRSTARPTSSSAKSSTPRHALPRRRADSLAH